MAKVLLVVYLSNQLISKHLRVKGEAGPSVSTVALWQAAHRTLSVETENGESPGPRVSTLLTGCPGYYN